MHFTFSKSSAIYSLLSPFCGGHSHLKSTVRLWAVVLKVAPPHAAHCHRSFVNLKFTEIFKSSWIVRGWASVDCVHLTLHAGFNRCRRGSVIANYTTKFDSGSVLGNQDDIVTYINNTAVDRLSQSSIVIGNQTFLVDSADLALNMRNELASQRMFPWFLLIYLRIYSRLISPKRKL